MTAGPEPPEALASLLARVAAGNHLPPDGGITILPQPCSRDCGVISFTAHSVIFTDADPAWVRAQLPDGDLGAPMNSRFLQALCAHTGRRARGVDMLCLTESQPGRPRLRLTRCAAPSHPRVALAQRFRDNVMAWAADGGLVLLGRGVAGRWEVAIEVEPDHRGRGLGRELAAAARHLIPAGVPLWAQISPGNVASVRAFFAAGYEHVGAEALLPAD
jgi:GNAT superfamily N-acetyltransferase